MQPSGQAYALIRRFEGFSPVVYRCPAGYPTIGYGHLVRDAVRFAKGIDAVEAERLLKNDARLAADAVTRLITAPLLQHQFDALVSFTFNLGAGALQRSALRRCLNRRAYGAAPDELMRWVYAGGRVLPGLVARREAEAQLYAA